MDKDVEQFLIENFGSTEKYDIIFTDNQDDLMFLIGQRFRPQFHKQKNNNHARWVKSALHNGIIHGKIINNTFINLGGA